MTATQVALVNTALRLVRAHPARYRRVTRLSAKLGISRRTLHRAFRAVRGETTDHAIARVRLLHALELVAAGLLVRDAARIAGYPDPFTMSNQCKRLLGIRPTAARRPGWRAPELEEAS
ncbi:MAG: helix-turn-helix domain-containing protein [Longimicrobiales bacterium]